MYRINPDEKDAVGALISIIGKQYAQKFRFIDSRDIYGASYYIFRLKPLPKYSKYHTCYIPIRFKAGFQNPYATLYKTDPEFGYYCEKFKERVDAHEMKFRYKYVGFKNEQS